MLSGVKSSLKILEHVDRSSHFALIPQNTSTFKLDRRTDINSKVLTGLHQPIKVCHCCESILQSLMTSAHLRGGEKSTSFQDPSVSNGDFCQVLESAGFAQGTEQRLAT